MTATATGSRRIRGRIPFETVVAHKTGTTAVVINDVGVITLPADSRIGGRLALAVYVADGSSIAAMERSIAELSAAAFDFFSGRQPAAAQKPQKRGSRR
jgi:beta-lactamase class A